MDDFVYRGGRFVFSFKLVQDVIKLNKLFEGDIIIGVIYRRWVILKCEVCVKEFYRLFIVKFFIDIIFQYDYLKWGVLLVESVKFFVIFFVFGKFFDDSIIYKDVFKAWEMQVVQKSGRFDEYRLSFGKFQGEFTMRSYYRGQYVLFVKFVRYDVYRLISGDMEMNTIYNDIFIGDRLYSCFVQGI